MFRVSAFMLIVILALAVQPAIQHNLVRVRIPLLIVSYNHQADIERYDNTGLNFWFNPKLLLVDHLHPEWRVDNPVPARYGDPKAILELATNFAFPWGWESEGKAALEFLHSLGEAKLCFSLEVRGFRVNEPLQLRVACWEDSPYPYIQCCGFKGYWRLVLPPGDYGDTCFTFKINVDYSTVRIMDNRTDIKAYVTSHVFQFQVIKLEYRRWREPMDYEGSFHLLTVWIEDKVPASMLPVVDEFTADGWLAVSELRDRPYKPYVVIPDEPEHNVDIIVNKESVDYRYAYWSFVENDGRVNATWLRMHGAVGISNMLGPRPFMLRLLNHSEGWISTTPWYQAWTWPRQTYNITVVIGGSLGNSKAKTWELGVGITWNLNPYRHELILRLSNGKTFKSDLEKSGPGAEGIALFMAFIDKDDRLIVLIEGDTRWGTKALADYLLELESRVGFDKVYRGYPTALSYPVGLEYRVLLPYILVVEYKDLNGDREYTVNEISPLYEVVGG